MCTMDAMDAMLCTMDVMIAVYNRCYAMLCYDMDAMDAMDVYNRCYGCDVSCVQ